MKNKIKKAAFTLVEIMIVVAIIGLLAAIGVPSFVKARSESQKKSIINNLRIFDSAIEQYIIANNGSTNMQIAVADLSLYIKGGTNNLRWPVSDTDNDKLTWNPSGDSGTAAQGVKYHFDGQDFYSTNLSGNY